MRLNRRHLQLALGAIWLLDGALQLQPFMFTTGFARRVIAPAATHQPAFVAFPVHRAASLIASNHVLVDVVFAGVQLAIGAALLSRSTAKAGLVATVGWAAGVWYFGEGLGGIASGHSTMLAGAPGAAAVYALVAVSAWPENPVAAAARARRRGSLLSRAAGRLRGGRSDLAPRTFAVVAWVVVWGTGSLLQLLPGQNSGHGLESELFAAAAGAPPWLATTDRYLGHLAANNGWVAVALGLVELLVGVLALRPGSWRLVASSAGIVLALAQWVLGQGMGQIYSGHATDPNAGLVIAVLGLAVASAGPAPGREASVADSAREEGWRAPRAA